MSGTRAMRAAGETYLPKEPGESDAAYKTRRDRSTLFNGFRKTVRDMRGKVFAKPITLGDDVPAQLVEYAENIDLAGRNLDSFAFDVLGDGLQTGISYVLVDAPPKSGGETKADEQRTGWRPYLVHIKAENLIGWKSATIEGVETLTQVRIRECATEDDPANPWAEKVVEQIRVLEPGRYQIWRRVEGKEEVWALFEEGTTGLDKITLCPVYINRTGFMTGEPPLEDLADINVAHWQSQSDQRNILHVARVPILFGSGIQQGEGIPQFTVSAGSLTLASDPNAKLGFVEHSGAAIGSGREDLKDLEFQLQTMGLELLIPKPGGQTATGEAIDQAAMHAPLALMALALKDALEQAFGYMAEYAGLGTDAGGSLTVNTDFGVSMRDAADLTALLGAVNAGHITKETFLRELKRRGVLSDELVPEEEVERLGDEAPELMGEALPLGSGTRDTGTLRFGDPDGGAALAPAPAVDLAAIEAMIVKAIGAIQFPAPQPQAPAAPAEPPVFNINVDVPAQQPPVVTVEAAQITVEAPQIHIAPPGVNVDVDAREGTTRTTVEEWTAEGRIKSFVKEPVAEERS
jgi:hypothetical protein